jgi:hypothetical protein
MHVTVTCQSIPSAELFRWANAGRRPPEEAIQRTRTCADMNPNDGSTLITQVPAPQLDRYSPDSGDSTVSEAELTAVSRLLRLREPHALKGAGSRVILRRPVRPPSVCVGPRTTNPRWPRGRSARPRTGRAWCPEKPSGTERVLMSPMRVVVNYVEALDPHAARGEEG